MKQEQAWDLFFKTGLVQAYLLAKHLGRQAETAVYEQAKTAFLDLTGQTTIT